LIFSLISAVPLFFLINFLIRKYREYLKGLLEKVPLLKSLKLAKAFDTFSGGGS